jgi:quercetin dioxygenase-like cupin family protein
MATGVMREDFISPNRWTEIVPGVNSIMCSLDEMSDNRTVVNCVFNPGAEMPIHEHDRVETVHIIGGTIIETVSGKLLREGDSKLIPSFHKHGWHSVTGCMMTVSWKPAYTKSEA